MAREAEDKGLGSENQPHVIAQVGILAGFVGNGEFLLKLAVQLVADLLFQKDVQGEAGSFGAEEFAPVKLFQKHAHLFGADGVLKPPAGGFGIEEKPAQDGLLKAPFPEGLVDSGDGAVFDEDVGGSVVADIDHQPAQGPDVCLHRSGEQGQRTAAGHFGVLGDQQTVLKGHSPGSAFLQNVEEQGKLDDTGGGVRLVFPDAEFQVCGEIFVVEAQMAGEGIDFPGNGFQGLQFFGHGMTSCRME